jgi:hypothetical protein
MNKPYILVKPNQNTDNKFIKGFKNSMFGMDIGIKSDNFKIKILLSTVIAFGTLIGIYYLFRI